MAEIDDEVNELLEEDLDVAGPGAATAAGDGDGGDDDDDNLEKMKAELKTFEEEAANFLVGLVYLVSAVASPALGWLLDRTGRQVDTLISMLDVRAVNEPSRISQCP